MANRSPVVRYCLFFRGFRREEIAKATSPVACIVQNSERKNSKLAVYPIVPVTPNISVSRLFHVAPTLARTLKNSLACFPERVTQRVKIRASRIFSTRNPWSPFSLEFRVKNAGITPWESCALTPTRSFSLDSCALKKASTRTYSTTLEISGSKAL